MPCFDSPTQCLIVVKENCFADYDSNMDTKQVKKIHKNIGFLLYAYSSVDFFIFFLSSSLFLLFPLPLLFRLYTLLLFFCLYCISSRYVYYIQIFYPLLFSTIILFLLFPFFLVYFFATFICSPLSTSLFDPYF